MTISPTINVMRALKAIAWILVVSGVVALFYFFPPKHPDLMKDAKVKKFVSERVASDLDQKLGKGYTYELKTIDRYDDGLFGGEYLSATAKVKVGTATFDTTFKIRNEDVESTFKPTSD